MLYINSWCRIRQHTVVANDQILFEDPDPDASAFLVQLYRYLDLVYPKFYKMDRLSQLGFLAAEILLDGHFDKTEYPADAVGIVLANAHSSLDTDIRYQESVLNRAASPALFVYTLPNIVMGEICIRHQFKGENAFFIFEQYDIPFLNDYINRLLEEGDARAVIGGWVDIFQNRIDALLYLVEAKQVPGSIIHNQQNVRELYGIVDTGS